MKRRFRFLDSIDGHLPIRSIYDVTVQEYDVVAFMVQ